MTTRPNQHVRGDPRRRLVVRRVVIAAVILAILVAGRLADQAGLFGRPTGTDVEVYHNQVFTVVRVVDGDTLDVNRADAVRGTPTTRVRLLGVDTPETVRPDTPVQHFGPEASSFTHRTALGRRVRLQLVPDGRTRGNHGRLLAYVIMEDGTMLNRTLVREGYAYADPRWDHPLRADFRRAMAAARREDRGLWAEATEEDLPYYLHEADRPRP